MKRTSLGLGVAAWGLLLAAGCASSNLAGMLFFQGGGDDRVVAGSLDIVSKSSAARLQGLGLEATVTKEGEAFSIASKAPDGSRFKLLLTSEKTGSEEKTKIKIEWLDRRNEEVHHFLLSSLENVAPR